MTASKCSCMRLKILSAVPPMNRQGNGSRRKQNTTCYGVTALNMPFYKISFTRNLCRLAFYRTIISNMKRSYQPYHAQSLWLQASHNSYVATLSPVDLVLNELAHVHSASTPQFSLAMLGLWAPTRSSLSTPAACFRAFSRACCGAGMTTVRDWHV